MSTMRYSDLTLTECLGSWLQMDSEWRRFRGLFATGALWWLTCRLLEHCSTAFLSFAGDKHPSCCPCSSISHWASARRSDSVGIREWSLCQELQLKGAVEALGKALVLLLLAMVKRYDWLLGVCACLLGCPREAFAPSERLHFAASACACSERSFDHLVADTRPSFRSRSWMRQQVNLCEFCLLGRAGCYRWRLWAWWIPPCDPGQSHSLRF